MTGEGVRIRIYCERGDMHGHTPLTTAVVRLLWDEHAAGVTVIPAIEGFGAARHMHSRRLVDLGSDTPVVIEWLDTSERFSLIWPKLEPLLGHAVVTREQVELLVGPHRAEV